MSSGDGGPQKRKRTSSQAVDADVPQGLRNRLARARYCEVCKEVKADGLSHASRTKHKFRALTSEEAEVESERWRLAQGGKRDEQHHHTQQRQVVQKEAWGQGPAATEAPAVYIYNFGKHKGKTLSQVQNEDKMYAAWCLLSGMQNSRPSWRDALVAANMWEQVEKDAAELRGRRQAAKTQAADGPAKEEHPEVCRLRELQTLADGEPPPLFAEGLPSQRTRLREKKSRAVVQLQNCSLCGCADHKKQTCPQQASLREKPDERVLVQAALAENRKKASLVSRLKYTALHQRSKSYESRPSQRARAELSRSLLDLACMRPTELADVLVKDGILPGLTGCPCPNVKCEQQTRGYGRQRVLGKLSGPKEYNTEKDKLSLENVHYRCQACRCRVPVFRGLPLLEDATWPGLAVLAYWCCVENVTVTQCCRMLRVGDDLVRRWYRQARAIMADDALHRQARIKFGGRGPLTTDLEADETCVCSWTTLEGPPDGAEGPKEIIYHWYVYMGVVERGNTEFLWLTPVGVTTSRNNPRLPPLEKEKWMAVCSEVFNEETNGVLMTDSAKAYASYKPVGIAEHFTVNHQEKEYSRSVSVLKDTSSGTRRAGMAGTQTLDHEWALLKQDIPLTGVRARTECQRAEVDMYIRAAQWKRQLSTRDRWPAFCEAAAEHMLKKLKEKEEAAPGVHPLCWKRGPSAVQPSQGNAHQPGQSAESMVVDVSWGTRYFESQESARCGRHAINNLVGTPQFTDADMHTACDLVLGETDDPREMHEKQNGWYSHSVLGAVFDLACPPTWRMLAAPQLHCGYADLMASTDICGVIVNQDGAHWTCVVKHAGVLWHVDSMTAPETLTGKQYERLARSCPMCFAVVRADSDL